ncbi:EmrB/QacA subfamily drug resistance transporter [Arthrobacter pascens]|uniref:MFS transporter n=1 Tax=Arthrobacter pascens TaxID=1677 RepID=UPI002855BB3F|nr:MFS transporter [Arthrobacter pascens]MDR6558595.1 EmrB/QacA subfamily drug resistance transporter [Arthrobacter pascens]
MKPEPTTASHPAAILAIVLVSYFMILLDNSVIFTALPSLQADLQLSTGELSWVQDAYTLVFGGLLLLGARAGDLLGPRRVFVFGLVVFSVASLLIGLAPTGWWAIAGRAVQGIGAAIVAPASLSLLTASFPEGRERTRAVALYGATAGIGASLGLVIGGALAHWISWRAGFFINVPIGAAMIALAPRFLPESGRGRGRFDVFGVSATLGVGALVFGIINTADEGWASPVTVTAVTVGVALLIAFVLIERRVAQPILPLRLFTSRRRTGAYLARFLYLGAMIAFFFFTTLFLQEVLGFDPLQAGMGFLPMTAVNFAVAMSIPRLMGKVPGSIPLVAGVLITLSGMFWLSRVGVDSGYLTGVALPMVLIGAGQGLAFAPLTSFGIIGAPAADAGAASGLVNTFHQVGTCLGLGIAVAAAATVPTTGSAVAHLASQVSVALMTGSILLLLALIVTAAFILPADLAAHHTKKQPGAAPAPQVQEAR